MSRFRPPYFTAAPTPPTADPIRVDADTTPRQLVWRTIFGARRLTLPAAVLMIGHQVGEALVPVVAGAAIDRAVATGDGGELVRWLLLLGVVFAVLSFCFRFGSRIGFLGMHTIQHRLRTAVTDRILDPRGMAGPPRSPGMLLSIATSDVGRLAMTVAVGLYPVGQLAAVVFCAVVLLQISWPLGLAVLLGAPALLWLMDRAGGPLRRRSEHEQQLAGEAAGSAADLMTGFRVIAGIGAQDEAARRYRSASARALTAVIRARRSEGAFLGVMTSAGAALVIAVGVAGGLMAVDGRLTIGQLITVVGLTQFLLEPLSTLGSNLGAVWSAGLASAKRVLDVLQAPPAVEPAGPTSSPADAVLRLHDVAGLSATVETEGMTVVVADAETTATLTAVLARRRRPESGSVTVGGVDLFDLDHASATSLVRVAPHSADLFEGSVAENVAGPQGADAARVDRALLAAGCEELLEVLPDGWDTPVGEAGRMLSGGQRQRVALARALAAETRLLVLVDPTNAVDSVTEARIADRLAAVRQGRATLVFTGSPAFLAAADHVLDLTVTLDRTKATV